MIASIKKARSSLPDSHLRKMRKLSIMKWIVKMNGLRRMEKILKKSKQMRKKMRM